MDCRELLEQRLSEASYQFDTIEHRPAPTAQEAAAAGATSGYEFAKAAVLIVDGRPQLHVVRAPDSVDFASVRVMQSGHEARLAREGEFEHLFEGCDGGALPPVAMTPGLPVYVDRRLLGHDRVAFEAGDGIHTIRMSTTDYIRFAGGIVTDIAEVHAGTGRRRRQGRLASMASLASMKRVLAGAGVVLAAAGGMKALPRVLPGRASRSFAAGAATGVAAVMLAEPSGGARRRARIRDQGRRYARRTNWWARKQARYWSGRQQGLRHRWGMTKAGSGLRDSP